MAGLLSTILLVVAQQTSPLPFEFDLPQGYAAFEPSGHGAWTSLRDDANASFRVHHFEIERGALPEAIAQYIRDNSWNPTLANVEHSMEAWKGTIDGIPGAGWIIQYKNGAQNLVVLQRIATQGDRMVMLVWEGPANAQSGIEKLLDGFRIPADWLAVPPPEVDIYRGMGPRADMQPFPGSLSIEVQVHAFFELEAIDVTVDYLPGLGPVAEGPLTWHLPAGAIALPLDEDLGGRRKRYRIPLHEDAGLGSPFGITRVGANSFSALDPQWLAIPSVADDLTRLYPPAWSLRLLHPSNLEPLAGVLEEQAFNETHKALHTSFQSHQAGLIWPFFLVADYELRQTSGVNWHLRLDSKASLEEDTMREIVRLRNALEHWLPGGAKSWTVASFPWIGDRVMPGLLVLDEQRGWFHQPVDALDQGLTRRVQLARLLCQERAGIRQHGLGSASFFLDASLAEYLSARLLEQAGNQNDADALQASWRLAEAQAGELLLPLSLHEIGDLYGPRRLLSFGPLVWQAMEQACGREAFDAFLQETLAQPGWWSTQDLEARLKKVAPDVDWDAFFLRHVYGRELPQAN
ncbi:MAG: hypothetical protein ACPG31_12570 [Planctomycetota bacterium]